MAGFGDNITRKSKSKSKSKKRKGKNRNVEAVRKFRNGEYNAIVLAGMQWQYEENMARIARGDYHLVD